jgi:hypothetical protein
MSEPTENKIEVYIEIGDNLRSVLEKIIDDADTYSEPEKTESLIEATIGSIRELVKGCLTLDKKEDKN